MSEIQSFEEAQQRLGVFLAASGHPSSVAFAFREDFYTPALGRHWVSWPLRASNYEHAERVFAAGRRRGLVEISARFWVGSTTVATVLAPEPDEIQGWSQGCMLPIIQPFTEARPVTQGWMWALHRRRSAYSQFQKHETFVHSRSAAA